MDKISPMPPLPDFNDIKSIQKWNEALKKRLRDAGQNVDDDPLNLNWPRPLPYVWPTDRKGVVI
jgi:hypothetical protein